MLIAVILELTRNGHSAARPQPAALPSDCAHVRTTTEPQAVFWNGKPLRFRYVECLDCGAEISVGER